MPARTGLTLSFQQSLDGAFVKATLSVCITVLKALLYVHEEVVQRPELIEGA
jgi:hypothetical protein